MIIKQMFEQYMKRKKQNTNMTDKKLEFENIFDLKQFQAEETQISPEAIVILRQACE